MVRKAGRKRKQRLAEWRERFKPPHGVLVDQDFDCHLEHKTSEDDVAAGACACTASL